MNEDAITYLKAIGMSQPLIDRVEMFYGWRSALIDEEILGIFVDDFIQDDGTRLYAGIWFFSDSYVTETGVFTQDASFDLVPLRKRIVRWDVSVSDYDFERATEKSRMNLRIDLGWPEISGTMYAARENCDYLTGILRSYIVPNMYVGSSKGGDEVA